MALNQNIVYVFPPHTLLHSGVSRTLLLTRITVLSSVFGSGAAVHRVVLLKQQLLSGALRDLHGGRLVHSL